MLWDPNKADEYLEAVGLHRMREIVSQQITFTLDAIGGERLAGLRALPIRWAGHDLTVVHAGPDDVWRSPSAEASDEELVNTYRPIGSPRVVYGHIHCAYVRQLPSFIVANSGCLSLSYDGDPRAAYAVVDDDRIEIRRVEYDVEREVAMLHEAQFPYAGWMAEIMRTASYVPPPEL